MEKTKNTRLNVNKNSNPKPCAGFTSSCSAVTPSLTGFLMLYGTLAEVIAEPVIPIMNFCLLNHLLLIKKSYTRMEAITAISFLKLFHKSFSTRTKRHCKRNEAYQGGNQRKSLQQRLRTSIDQTQK